MLKKWTSLLELLLILRFVNCSLNSSLNSSCYHNGTKVDGVCISVKNCKSAQEEIRLGQKLQLCNPPFVDGIPVVCCPQEIGNGTIAFAIAEDQCKKYSEKVPIHIDPRIVGGKDVSLGEFPHMALIGMNKSSEISWGCGGSLLSETFILTAAHCLRNDIPAVFVQLGDVVRNSFLSENFKIKRTYKHPDYLPTSAYNDIGLLELVRPVTFSENIQPACLPEAKLSDLPSKLIVTGFGNSFYGATESMETLQKIEVDHYSSKECAGKYRRTSKIPNGILDTIQICYGNKSPGFGKDACQGDSGGPLQYKDQNKLLHRIIGIVSTGAGCGSSQKPGIYTRISFYVPWIVSIVWKQEMDKKIHPSDPDCIDNPYFANCLLIVKHRHCSHKYYGKFCCRSCVAAGQL